MKKYHIPQELVMGIRNVNYVTVQRPQGFKKSAMLTGRKQYSFIYTVAGKMRYTFQDNQIEDIIALSGDLVLIPAGTKHDSLYTDEENTVAIIRFDLTADILPKYLREPSLIQMDNAVEVFTKINNDLNSGIADNPIYYMFRIYELMWYLASNYERHLPHKFKKLRPAIKEINEYYNLNHKVGYYADLCGMSESAFRRLFHEYTKMSPVEYRNRVRLHEAKNLLNSGAFYIAEVAEATGFSSLSFFCRSYKKMFGCSPGQAT